MYGFRTQNADPNPEDLKYSLSLTIDVTVNKSLNNSGPQFPHLDRHQGCGSEIPMLPSGKEH
jgi:hypothetical protein